MLCARCQCPIEEVARPLGSPGGKPAYFDWTILRDLRPGSSESVLVPQGRYATTATVRQAGYRQASAMGIKVRAKVKTSGVRFWRVA